MTKVFLFPSGPKNLASLFPGVDWERMDEYYLELFASDMCGLQVNEECLTINGQVFVVNNGIGESELTQILTTPHFRTGCCCVPDRVRVHFLNYLGTFDAINFNPPKITRQVASAEYQKGLRYPLQKPDTGVERFNVRSNQLYECRTGCYSEKNMAWCMELLEAPKAFIEWKGTQGQADSFLPIRIEDAKFEERKEEMGERHTYELVVQFRMANEKILLRN